MGSKCLIKYNRHSYILSTIVPRSQSLKNNFIHGYPWLNPYPYFFIHHSWINIRMYPDASMAVPSTVVVCAKLWSFVAAVVFSYGCGHHQSCQWFRYCGDESRQDGIQTSPRGFSRKWEERFGVKSLGGASCVNSQNEW
jgi:hypothetical protein